MASDGYTVIGVKGYGSAIVEAALEWAGLAYAIEQVDPKELGPGSARFAGINPLGQVPTLLLPDGSAMTESAAMILHLADIAPEAGLAPPAGHPARRSFLRWLVFLVAAIYPTFTFGDDPSRFVSSKEAQRELRRNTNIQREDLWRFVEANIAPNPWVLGQDFSALDIYAAAMGQWRPGPSWFADNCPKLHGIAGAALNLAKLKPVWERNGYTA